MKLAIDVAVTTAFDVRYDRFFSGGKVEDHLRGSSGGQNRRHIHHIAACLVPKR